jgi:hypothetical protein
MVRATGICIVLVSSCKLASCLVAHAHTLHRPACKLRKGAYLYIRVGGQLCGGEAINNGEAELVKLTRGMSQEAKILAKENSERTSLFA